MMSFPGVLRWHDECCKPRRAIPLNSLSQPTRVLLVDDSEAMLARATRVLSPGCEIVGAVKDGRAALEAAKTLQPDVVVLDISMPGMTGLEVAACLRQNGITSAVVFLTVHDDEEFVQAARNAGGTGYVVKLRLASDLMLAVQEARDGRSFVSTLSSRPS
jgi:DNA-binding NarL/FixJ family response regulator